MGHCSRQMAIPMYVSPNNALDRLAKDDYGGDDDSDDDDGSNLNKQKIEFFYKLFTKSQTDALIPGLGEPFLEDCHSPMMIRCNCAVAEVLDAVAVLSLRFVLSYHTVAVDDREHYSANRQVMHLQQRSKYEHN